jgi:hypothetical protein
MSVKARTQAVSYFGDLLTMCCRLITEYKSKNIMLVAGYKNAAPIQFSVFNKLVPASCLAKALSHACFGFHHPISIQEKFGEV